MRIALAQITPSEDAFRNAEIAADAIRDAAAQGADLVVLPEASLAPFGTDLLAAAGEHGRAFDARLTEVARESGVVVVAGSFAVAPQGRVHNRVIVRGPSLHADYDKIHLYDAFGARESDTVAAGDELVTVEVAGTRVGIATCYDVRFPEQFRALAEAGADVVVLPAAWDDGPGKLDQWRLLTRARALDATVFLLATDQAPPAGEVDPAGPRGIGHSIAVSPSGEVLGELDREAGTLVLDLDPALVGTVRETLPVLRHAVPLGARDVEARG